MLFFIAHARDEVSWNRRDDATGDVREIVERDEGARVDERCRGARRFTAEVTVILEVIALEAVEGLGCAAFDTAVVPANLDLPAYDVVQRGALAEEGFVVRGDAGAGV